MTPLHKVFMPENIEEGLIDVLKSGQVAYGKYSKLFEDEIRIFIGNDNTLAISGNAVLFALQLLGIKDGDEVIASPMSCLMTTQPIALCHAKVVWADIDPLTGTLNPDDVRKKITSKTKAIIHYHWAGYPGYIDEINAIGQSVGIPVIEEASMAFGSEYKGKKIGNTASDIVCYSFGPVRLPNVLEGAGLSFNDKTLYEKALSFRDLGINRQTFRDECGEISISSDVESRGNTSTLNDVNGFIGQKQMGYLPTLLDKHQLNAQRWQEKFIDSENIYLLDSRSEIRPNYWVYSLLIKKDRNKMLLDYKKKGLLVSKLHLRNDVYSVFNLKNTELKGVDKFSNEQLNLPCGWWVCEEVIDNV